MTTSDFARRHGYAKEHPVFESPDYLPDDVRVQAGMMMVESFEHLFEPPAHASDAIRDGLAWPNRLAHRRFTEVVHASITSQHSWTLYQDNIHRVLESKTHKNWPVRRRLVVPLGRCDWRLFYEVVEGVSSELYRLDPMPAFDFAPGFNLLLQRYGIPWMLQDGLVIPRADQEFAEELKYAREVTHSPTAERESDPHGLIKDALAALYRKQGGPDRAAACVNAWGAWKAVAGTASGFGARDKRAFSHIEKKHPQLISTMNDWQKLAQEGRHPESGDLPTEAETRFIVMLCVIAVRFLCPTCNSEDAA